MSISILLFAVVLALSVIASVLHDIGVKLNKQNLYLDRIATTLEAQEKLNWPHSSGRQND